MSERELSPVLRALYRGDRPAAEEAGRAAGALDVFDAAALGDAQRLRELLDADPALAGAWSPDGFTPLHYAAFFGGPEAVRVLAGAGANLEEPARNEEVALGAHPLHSAIAARRLDSCAALVEAGADTAAVYEGRTPAELARDAGLDWPAEWSNASS